MRRKGVYAASLDPLTNGHMWVIEQGARLFDEFVVAIGTNPGKRYTFTLNERLAMLRESTAGLENVTIDAYVGQFLVTYGRSIGAQYILRGIRTEQDYEYERTMMRINSDLDPAIETIFLMPPREIAEVSSSMVKDLVGPEGWEEVVRHYVPEPVFRRLMGRYGVVPAPSRVEA
ncbi:MAG: pantetheine-phosphate adenylyltransferase [Chloroflexota bacterium]